MERRFRSLEFGIDRGAARSRRRFQASNQPHQDVANRAQRKRIGQQGYRPRSPAKRLQPFRLIRLRNPHFQMPYGGAERGRFAQALLVPSLIQAQPQSPFPAIRPIIAEMVDPKHVLHSDKLKRELVLQSACYSRNHRFTERQP